MTRPAERDPFDTARLRRAALTTWTTTPSRFREDANAEELLAASYATRVIAELAANGADAARAAGIRGEIAIRLIDDGSSAELRVANTGVPLDAAGVAALAALRASAKRDTDAVGRFGVGFTAVRALTDEPMVVSTTGSIRFSRDDTARAITEIARAAPDRGADLLAELDRRQGVLPILRLPWPVSGEAPDEGFATEVRLPLRDDGADLASTLTVDLAADLLWALSDLAAVSVPGYRVVRSDDRGVEASSGLARLTVTRDDGTAVSRRYRTVVREGKLPAALLANRPVEERSRTRWRIAWIATDETPMAGDSSAAAEPAPDDRGTPVGAPTATGERIAVPARLIATLPVDEARGTIALGPLTDYLVTRAADAYLDLVRSAPVTRRTALLPETTFPLGPFDAALRKEIGAVLAAGEVLVDAAGIATRPDRVLLVPGVTGAAARRIAEVLPGLIGWPDRADDVSTLRGLGARIEPISAVTAALAGLDRPVGFWRDIYDGLSEVPADELSDLPVPRRGGGTLIGPRGVLLPEPSHTWADRAAQMIPGLRLASDGVDHRLLRRLGALPADPPRILADPLLAAEIERRYDEDDAPEDSIGFAELVADLATESSGNGEDLARLLLTDSEGDICPAGELLLPDAPLADVLEGAWPTVGRRWLERYGAEVLLRLGVRFGFGTATVTVGADLPDLPDVEDWWAETAQPGPPHEIAVIRDLDCVAPDRWLAALGLIAEDPAVRDCLHGSEWGPSYSAWWIGRFARIDGRPPRSWRLAGAQQLAGIYDAFPGDLPEYLLGEIGVLSTLAEAAADPAELMRRWADPERRIAVWQVPAVTAALIDRAAELELPAGVRVLSGAVVDAEAAAVLDHPMLAQVWGPDQLVAGGADPSLVADRLDLPLASEVRRWQVAAADGAAPDAQWAGSLGEIEGAGRALAAAGRPDLADAPALVDSHLAVVRAGVESEAGERGSGGPVRVSWWMEDGRVLADGSPEGIGRAVAHLAGSWGERHRLVAAARDAVLDQTEAGLD